MIDKGQKEEMSTLIRSIKVGIAPISLHSLILNTCTTILAVESIQSGKSYPVSLKTVLGE